MILAAGEQSSLMTAAPNINPSFVPVPYNKEITATVPAAPVSFTTAVIIVSDEMKKEAAGTPPKLTPDAFKKLNPLIVTIDEGAPGPANPGLNDLIAGVLNAARLSNP